MSAKASVEEIQDGLNNEEIIELQDLRYHKINKRKNGK
jgi:hypothetical protein